MGGLNHEEFRALLQRYDKYKEDKTFLSNEKQVCQSLIVPLIGKVLHWETDEPSEFKTEVSQAGKRIDYVVCNQGISQFIVEAKAPSRDIYDSEEMYSQAISYGYGKDRDFAILTNFRQLVILGCKIKARNSRESEIARIDLLHATPKDLELLGCFEREFWLSSGRSSPLYAKLGAHKPSIPLDEQLFEDLKEWRSLLLSNIKQHPLKNKYDFEDEHEFMHIEEEVQRLINRLIFICFCEDKELKDSQLKGMLDEKNGRFAMKPGWLLEKIKGLFTEYRRDYNSDLFDHGNCDDFFIEDGKLVSVLEDLRQPKDRPVYDFKSIEADILGKSYENFIGHVQRGKKRFKEQEDKGKRKSEGIYYTPKFIVDYIVNNTVRPKVKGKTFSEILLVKVLDPACGSGSFLLRAYDVLMEEAQRSLGREPTYDEKRKLMLSCIHGVDVDERAIEMAKLSLSLRLASRGEKLPQLRENIRLGNSLIDDKNVAHYKAFSWKEEFKDIMGSGGFDVIVGNPPYIRIQTLDNESVDHFNKKYISATKNYDIYALFVEKGLSLLKEEGDLGFILPSKFFSADYGEGLRKTISTQKSLHKIVDFKDYQVFEGATTYTCLLFLNKEKNKSLEYLELSDHKLFQQTNEISKSFIKSKQESPSDDEAWNFVSGEGKTVLKKLSSLPQKLVDISQEIYQGIITGADKIFILKKIDQDTFFSVQTNKNYKFEKSIMFPLLKGSKHIRRYREEKSDKWVLFPYSMSDEKAIPIPEEEFKKKYPVCYGYLLENKPVLQKRDGGKMKSSQWYIFSRNQSLNKIGHEKLMTPSIANSPSFTYDNQSKFFFVGSGGGGGGAYGITLKNKNLYLHTLAILNSSLIDYFIRKTSSKFSGGYFAFNKQYIENIPILVDVKFQNKIEMLSQKELELNKHLSEMGDKQTNERTRLEEDIKKTDSEIDSLVYTLYNITEEEQKIIEQK